MKFSLKMLLSTLIVMAIGLGFSGFYFVNHVFQTSLKREIAQALDDNSILSFAMETAALNIPAKYNVLQDNTVGQIGYNLESSGHSSGRLIRISDENRQVLYMSDGFITDDQMLMQTEAENKTYRLLNLADQYFIQCGIAVNTLDRVLYLETMKDVSAVFHERAEGFSLYRKVTVAMLVFGFISMYFISSWLTRPIRFLTRATRRMSYGDYDYRAKQVSNDELGQLTMDFNKMAIALEENINKLEAEIESREDFVAAFAHELKTPLTAIIGYADMLRSRKLDEEKSFMSANYIYTEGKRLEAMSFRLLDLIVTKRHEVEFQNVSAETLIQNLYEMYAVNQKIAIKFRYHHGMIRAEQNLIKSVLINLLDNACKASGAGMSIEVLGRKVKGGYRFSVRDYGEGIPQAEQHKITQAFYMVDKSRSRSRNGAGLGLALCAEILALHGSKLEIESEVGKGTCISFVLPDMSDNDKGGAS
ncbi:MAG: ATP-binding protein [Lachnospiraceae bacterium]